MQESIYTPIDRVLAGEWCDVAVVWWCCVLLFFDIGTGNLRMTCTFTCALFRYHASDFEAADGCMSRISPYASMHGLWSSNTCFYVCCTCLDPLDTAKKAISRYSDNLYVRCISAWRCRYVPFHILVSQYPYFWYDKSARAPHFLLCLCCFSFDDVKTCFAVWVPIHYINFRFVPIRFRLSFAVSLSEYVA